VASWQNTELTLEEVSGSLLGHSLGPKKLHETVDLSTEPTADLAAMIEEGIPKLLEKAQAQLLESPLKLTGQIGHSGCSYEVEATWTGSDLTSGNVSGELKCTEFINVKLLVGWSEEDVTIEKLDVELAGVEEELARGGSFTTPDSGALDIPDMVESLLPSIAAQATEAVANAGADLGSGDSGNPIAELIEEQAQGTPAKVLGILDKYCETGPTGNGTKEVPECHTFTKEEGTKPNFGSILDDAVSEHKPSGACPTPGVEATEEADNTVFVCIPVMLGGTFDAGDKNVVVMPGGAIVAVGAESGKNEAEIKTSGSVQFTAGAVGGAGLRIDAGENVEVNGGFIFLLGSLQIHASGAVNVTSGDVLAGHVAIESDELSIGGGTAVSSDGVGGPGGPCTLECPVPGWGIAPKSSNQPGGASLQWGGSHAGYGSFGYEDPDTHTGWELLDPAAPDTWGQPPPPVGRGRTFDNAFDPKDPGSGGGGSELNYGYGGGGIIEIASTSLKLDGQLSADGSGRAAIGDPDGGAGAGGSINVATGALSGDGKLEADGGGLCKECTDALGNGAGGGGMISERYTASSFTGKIQAIGGEDLDNPAEDLRPYGGAGTVYQLQTEEAPSAPKYGSASKEQEEKEDEEDEIPELEDLAKPAAPEALQSARTSAAPTGVENDAVAGASQQFTTRQPSPAHVGFVSHPTCPGRVVARRSRACAARVDAAQLAKLNLSPTSFVPDPTGNGASAASAGLETGTTISYSDSLAATVVFDVDSPLPGLREQGHCVRASSVPKRKRRKLRSCTYLSLLGSFTHSDRRGSNKLHFTGRLRHSSLPPGKYELRATPHLGHHDGSTTTASFRVLAPSTVQQPAGALEAPKESHEVPKESPNEEKPSPKGEKRASAGTLIINDGHSAAEPPSDGTPLPEGPQTKNMTLEIEGGARVYASHGEWAKIVISGDSRLTVQPPSKLPAPTLGVKAGEIEVQAGSSIEANSLGYAGAGLGEEKGMSAPGVTVSTWAAGGSHGGRGAVNPELHERGDGESGATYDNPEDPNLPGGGGGGGYNDETRASSGGGVIDVTAETLVLDGAIEANGENDWGPTLEEPFWYEHGAGTGAGGSIQIHAGTLSGTGQIQANGGTACVQSAESSDPALQGSCAGHAPGGNETTGGGGLILVQAPNHGGFTGHITATGGRHGFTDGSAGVITGP
jgi:hypothetical protein